MTPGIFNTVMTIGLKTLVNTDTTRQYVVPASGISARFYKIEWTFNTFAVFVNAIFGTTISIRMEFTKLLASTLNYDGKPQQTDFYSEKSENYYTSPQLRAINIGNIQMEPKIAATDAASTGAWSLNYETASANSYLAAILQPVVTFYKK